jgi:hypothetical protein
MGCCAERRFHRAPILALELSGEPPDIFARL